MGFTPGHRVDGRTRKTPGPPSSNTKPSTQVLHRPSARSRASGTEISTASQAGAIDRPCSERHITQQGELAPPHYLQPGWPNVRGYLQSGPKPQLCCSSSPELAAPEVSARVGINTRESRAERQRDCSRVSDLWVEEDEMEEYKRVR